MPSNYGITASSFSIQSEPTSISLYGMVTTVNTSASVTNIISADTIASPNFSINENYYDPELYPSYIQTVTIEATLLDSIGNPVAGQSVYFYLEPISAGSPIQFGTSSLGSGNSSTMITDEYGKIQDVFSAVAWVMEGYDSYTIRAVFDGNLEGTLSASNSSTGRIILSGS
jgi:hypothetical protein